MSRYTLHLSDGQFSINFSVLATEFRRITKNLTRLDVVKVKEFTYNKLFLLSLEVNIVTPGTEVGVVLGTPCEIKTSGDIPAVLDNQYSNPIPEADFVQEIEAERRRRGKQTSALNELFGKFHGSGITASEISKSEDGKRYFNHLNRLSHQ